MGNLPSIIIKSSARGGAVELAAHLVSDENETVRIVDVRGIEKENLRNMLRQIELMGAGSRSRRPLDHASINPAPGIHLNDRQVVDAFSIYDRTHGLPEDTPKVILCHQKRGRTHYHQVSLRIDMLRMVAAPDGWRYRRNEETARQIESAFGLEQGKGRFTGRTRIDGHVVDARPVCYLTHAEHQQAKRLGLDQTTIDAVVQSAWAQSDCGAAFAAALRAAGYALARGDRRDAVIVDPAGGVHSPRRRLKDVEGQRIKAADIKARFADLDLAQLPSLEDVKRALRNKPSPIVSQETEGLRLLAASVAEKRSHIGLLGRLRHERRAIDAEIESLRSIAKARVKHMARMQQARKRRLAQFEEIRGDAARKRRAVEELAHRLTDASEARLRRETQRLDETSRRYERLLHRKDADWESVREAPEAPGRKASTTSLMAPLDFASDVKWRMLSSYYATTFDRHAAPFIRFVNIPRDRDVPLAVDLKSKETLLDYGDEIRLDRCGGVSQDAVTVLVSMVKAHGWSSVILRGSDQFIASASQALENEGISWRAGCEQDGPSAPRLPATPLHEQPPPSGGTPLAPLSLPNTFDDDIEEIDALLDQCDRYERDNDDKNDYYDGYSDNTRPLYDEDHLSNNTSESQNSHDYYQDIQDYSSDDVDVDLGDDLGVSDTGGDKENIIPISPPTPTAEFLSLEESWDLGDDLGIDPFEPVHAESKPMLGHAPGVPLDDFWDLGDELGRDPFDPGEEGTTSTYVSANPINSMIQPPNLDEQNWRAPDFVTENPVGPLIEPGDAATTLPKKSPPPVNPASMPPVASPAVNLDRIPEVTAYRHALAGLAVEDTPIGSRIGTVEAMRSARVAVGRLYPGLEPAALDALVERTLGATRVSVHRKILGWERMIENGNRYKAALQQRREPDSPALTRQMLEPPKSGRRRFNGRDRDD